jgi:hypothetical protein
MAPKKAAKHAAKKAPKHHDKKHHAGKDTRRAYEHLGRVTSLQVCLPKAAMAQIHTLTELARVRLSGGDSKSAAELLRACEHLGFGALAGMTKESVAEDLRAAIAEQFEKSLEKAAEHWDDHEQEPSAEITAIYETTYAAAEGAYDKGVYRRALELARAAESIAHVGGEELLKLDEEKKKPKKLKT